MAETLIKKLRRNKITKKIRLTIMLQYIFVRCNVPIKYIFILSISVSLRSLQK
jgi:hypothetical protein